MTHHGEELGLHLSGFQGHVARARGFAFGKFQGRDIAGNSDHTRGNAGSVSEWDLGDRSPNIPTIGVGLLLHLVDDRFAGENDALLVLVK